MSSTPTPVKVLDEDGVVLLTADIKTLSDATYETKKLIFSNTSVATSSFVSDQTYSDYPYKAAITLTGVTSTMVPEVIFDLENAVSGMFAPVAQSYSGGIYIYTNDVPSSTITIPTIICWKGSS